MGNQERAELERQASIGVPQTNDPQELCIFHHKRGWANFRLGHYDLAVSELKKALSLNQPNGLSPDKWCDRWLLQVDFYVGLYRSGDYIAAIEFLKSVAVERQHTSPYYYFYNQMFMMDSYANLGMFKEVEEAFRRASDVLPEVKQQTNWADIQYGVMTYFNNRAALLQQLRGNYAEGERFSRLALDNARQDLRLKIAKFSKDDQVLRLAKVNAFTFTLSLAYVLAVQSKLGEAEYLATEALDQTISYATFNTIYTSSALSTLATIKLEQGKIAEASRYYELAAQALEKSAVEPYSLQLAARRANVGLVACIQGRWNDALRVFDARDQGLRSNVTQFTKVGSGNIDWAMALLRTGQGVKATKMLQGVLQFNLRKPFVDPVYLAHRRGYLGVALTEQRENSQALTQFQMALPILLKAVNENRGDEDSGFVNDYRLRVIVEGYLELLGKMHAAGQKIAGLDAVSEAFRMADVARNSSVQRAVTSSAARATLPDARLAQLARREQDTTNQIHALNKILVRLASAPESQRLPKVMEDMARDIERLTAEQAALREEISQKFPDYANLVNPQPATPADIQRVLLPEEALIAIYTGERQSYVWTISAKEVGFRVVPVTREQISHDVASIRSGLDLSDGKVKAFDAATAYSLYNTLLAPDSSVWAQAKLLNVIPDAHLGELPFGVLLTAPVSPATGKSAAYADMPWLIRKVAIAQQSSASGFMALRRATAAKQEQKAFIGFGNPLFTADAAVATQRGGQFRKLEVPSAKDPTLGLIEQAQQSAKPLDNAQAASRPTLAQAFALLPALPDTAEELTEIARTTGAHQKNDLFLGARATEANVKATDLSQYRVVAFATHGLVPGEISGLDQPALAMANPALTNDTQNDGFLTLEEVLGLKLNAEWVVLSACNTASADGNAREAVSGLGRGFFYAGARSLLVSNWAVETVSARLLTTGLFHQLATHPDMPRAEALRQSMLTIMKDQTTDYSHPAFWAPFSLVGDGAVQ